ncbi:hypothetical protein [Nonomuraea sp. NPDC049758]|uniref:hypothetical protein n=1 Tax=Nonomuraea sp. NPDC049758 TaxID=3154360 RepID=UPI00344058F7
MVINVVEWTRLEPWRVARARTDRDETVIIKWTGPHASRARDEPWRLRTEAAALRFLSEGLGAALAPRVLAVDLGEGRLVLEDLAPRTALDGLLRRHGAGAHADRLTAAARARGELGAITAGHAEAYYRRRAALGPVDPAADRLGRVARQRESGMPSLLGVPGPGWLSLGGPAEGEAYRQALAAGIPQAEDDGRYGRGPAAACVSYALARLTRLAMLDGRPAGDDSRAQLVAILEAAACTAEGALPQMAGWCRQVAAAVRRRWPDADVDLGALAPYTPRR